jgi:hypothetical protein
MTAAQRGDLAEEMLPVAAHLAVLVHGDGGPEDVREVLGGLSETQKDALLVVLAGLVDPEQPVGKALGWLDFNEHGALTVPASWSERCSVRDLVPEPAEEPDSNYIDEVAVRKFVRGLPVNVTDDEFIEGVKRCAAMDMTCPDIDALHGWARKTTENRINKLRKQYQRSGREFPEIRRPGVREFTEQEVVAIRERSAGGATDLEIGMSFDTSRETIRTICLGQRYPQYGGPIREKRSQKGLKASREYMCGHASNSRAANKQNEMGEAA